ncbi:MAG: hypothetical protein FIB04_10860 [Gammaproteobacteria bacterium]|nr:hypothetical protein [Gammaproteobacteria bacterium]
MSTLRRCATAAALALCLSLVAGCESGGSGGSASYAYYGGTYYPGGYYPGYYPGYPCCWDDDVIIVNPPDRPGNGGRPEGPTTLPGHPEQLPSTRPSTKPAPAPATRPAPAPAARPAPRPTPRPMGGGGRRR